MIAKMLVPTDGSEYSMEAATFAAAIARQFGAEVTLLHVVELPAVPMSPTILATEAQVRQELTEAGYAILAMTEKPFAQAGVPVKTELRHGPVAQTIIDVAASEGHELIVVGSRGRSGRTPLLLGSVSEAVAREAPCSVLIARKRGAGTP